ncbi:MAG: AzlC family ABC transporter permease, partial [Paracoccus sp. (in: a-proteobacteria)]|nr:AzlC family ABC transporter permease [Paracoccus sp. (in: a-proteobacteria)]
MPSTTTQPTPIATDETAASSGTTASLPPGAPAPTSPPGTPTPKGAVTSLRRCVALGLLHSIPLLLVTVPFGVLFGVVAVETGLDMAQIMGFSALVLAGASQFTAVQLISDNVPVWLVILSALAVNLRLAMYSAALVPHLGQAPAPTRALVAFLTTDQTYGISVERFQRHPEMSLPQRLAYFGGTAIALAVPWLSATVAGATIGRAIPVEMGLDFAIPITFLAMVAPALRTIAHIAAAFVAVVLALAFAFLP